MLDMDRKRRKNVINVAGTNKKSVEPPKKKEKKKKKKEKKNLFLIFLIVIVHKIKEGGKNPSLTLFFLE